VADAAPRTLLRADSGDRLKVPVVILGLGRVGRALVSAIAARRTRPSATTGVDFWVAAVADTSGAARMSPAEGYGDGHRRLGSLVMAKARGETLAMAAGGTNASFAEDIGAALSAAEDYGPEAPIIVDATAGDTGPLLARLRGRGWRLVLANKLPLTGSLAQWEAVTGLPGSGQQVRWEATVASALPVVTSVRRLALCGDRVHRISGVVSGTIGFIFASIEAGAEASAALAEAVRLGLAEPDPRGDLGGLDTCRKALILARSAGFALEADRVERLPPYPAE